MTSAQPTPALAWGAATDTGRVRTENEDTFVATAMVFGVADGMGGHQAGEVASAIAASTMRDRLGTGAPSVDVAVAAVVEANAAIFHGAHSNSEQRGMGTTLTAMVVLTDSAVQRRLALLNVGDSRTYVLRGQQMRRVTVDHSYVQELVSTGHITEHEARSHPRRNIVTRALGIEPTVRVDTWVLPFVAGDRYVLCSDGLVDEVDDPDIISILLDNPDPQVAADALVVAANASGGRDNVTVVVVDVLEGEAPSAAMPELDVDRAWGDDDDDDDGDDELPDRLIDAEQGSHSPAALAPTPSREPITAQLPVVSAPPTRRRVRLGLGGLLFGLALGVIAMLTVVLVLVVRNNATNDPAPTSTTTTSTTTSTTSTTSTSTTVVTTTTQPGNATSSTGL